MPTTNDARSSDVIVIGAGLAGLCAAIHLAERGLQVHLLEAADLAGGRVCGGQRQAIEHAGRQWLFESEHGIHAIWSPYVNLSAVLARLNIPALGRAARHEAWLHGADGRVYRAETGSLVRNSPIPAPFHYLALFARPQFLALLTPLDLLGLPRVAGSLFSALAYDPLTNQEPLAGRTLADLLQGWPPAARAFVSALMRSGFPGGPDEVPLAGALAFLRFYTLLRRDAWRFHYLSATAGPALIDPLVNAAEQAGVRLQLNTRATRLTRTQTGWDVAWEDPRTPGGANRLQCTQLILALDAPAARQLLSNSPDTAEQAVTLHWPHAAATAIVRLWYASAPRDRIEAGVCSGELPFDNFFWLQRILADFEDWHHQTGGAAIECHIYGPASTLELPDALLLARAATAVERAWPELQGQRINGILRRNPATHTLLGVGSDLQHPGVASPWPAIRLCGDWVRYPLPSLFLERACATALVAANQVLETFQLPTWPLQPYPRPEPAARLLQAGLRRLRWLIRQLGRPAVKSDTNTPKL